MKGGADEKNQAQGGVDGVKMRTFSRKLLEITKKSNPKGSALALDPPLFISEKRQMI